MCDSKWDAFFDRSHGFFAATDLITDILFIVQVGQAMELLQSQIGNGPTVTSVDPYGCIWHDATCSSLQYQYTANSMTYQSAIAFLAIAGLANFSCALFMGNIYFIYWKSFNEGLLDILLSPCLLISAIPCALLLPCIMSDLINSQGRPTEENISSKVLGIWFDVVKLIGMSWWFDNKSSKSARALAWPFYFVHVCAALIAIFIISAGYIALGSIVVSFCLCVNIVVPLLCMSNADLNLFVYGKAESAYAMTIIGLIAEDVPQFCIQLGYAVSMANSFDQEVSPLQWTSFTFTMWRFGFTFLLKVSTTTHRIFFSPTLSRSSY